MPKSSVAVLPGCTDVTRRPVPAVSRRKLCSVASTKNLLAEYTPRPGKTFLPASDEMATMCPDPAGQHRRDDGREAVQKTLAVHVDRSLPLVCLHVRHHRVVHDARARHQDIDGSELLGGLAHKGLYLRLIRYVGLMYEDFDPRGGKLFLEGFEGVGPTRCNRNVCTFSC